MRVMRESTERDERLLVRASEPRTPTCFTRAIHSPVGLSAVPSAVMRVSVKLRQ